jgi:ABC-type branched-subunit amino acid transport system ATPase component
MSVEANMLVSASIRTASFRSLFRQATTAEARNRAAELLDFVGLDAKLEALPAIFLRPAEAACACHGADQ